jgi:para-nitrobenzyl esterase
MDLPFTFANISRWGRAPFIHGLPSDVIERVSRALHPAWIRFVRDGDPNHGGIPHWGPFQSDDRAILVVGDDDIRVSSTMPSPPICA